MSKRLSAVILIALILFLGTASCAAVKPEAALLDLINVARQDSGLPLLKIAPEISAVARDHAADMIAEDYFGHISPTTGTLASRLRAGKIEYDCAGENLAGDTSISHTFALWMESPSHKGNVLGDFATVGIAVVSGGPYGLMIVAVFVR